MKKTFVWLLFVVCMLILCGCIDPDVREAQLKEELAGKVFGIDVEGAKAVALTASTNTSISNMSIIASDTRASSSEEGSGSNMLKLLEDGKLMDVLNLPENTSLENFKIIKVLPKKNKDGVYIQFDSSVTYRYRVTDPYLEMTIMGQIGQLIEIKADGSYVEIISDEINSFGLSHDDKMRGTKYSFVGKDDCLLFCPFDLVNGYSIYKYDPSTQTSECILPGDFRKPNRIDSSTDGKWIFMYGSEEDDNEDDDEVNWFFLAVSTENPDYVFETPEDFTPSDFCYSVPQETLYLSGNLGNCYGLFAVKLLEDGTFDTNNINFVSDNKYCKWTDAAISDGIVDVDKVYDAIVKTVEAKMSEYGITDSYILTFEGLASENRNQITELTKNPDGSYMRGKDAVAAMLGSRNFLQLVDVFYTTNWGKHAPLIEDFVRKADDTESSIFTFEQVVHESNYDDLLYGLYESNDLYDRTERIENLMCLDDGSVWGFLIKEQRQSQEFKFWLKRFVDKDGNYVGEDRLEIGQSPTVYDGTSQAFSYGNKLYINLLEENKVNFNNHPIIGFDTEADNSFELFNNVPDVENLTVKDFSVSENSFFFAGTKNDSPFAGEIDLSTFDFTELVTEVEIESITAM